jgi:hypothetical protein
MVSAFIKAQIERNSKKKSNKFGAIKQLAVVKLVIDGKIIEQEIRFDSKAELRYYQTRLLPLINAGEILDLKFHENYILQPAFEKAGRKYRPIKYEADFTVKYKNGEVDIIDIKGWSTDTFKLKQRLFEYKFPDKTIKLEMV